jgi:hypothetical protein
MGKDEKPSFKDRLKAGLDKAKVEAAKAAEVVADKAEKASKSGVKAIKKGASVVAEKAGEAKAYADEKVRSGLDHAYESKQTQAAANLKRVRKSNPDATPAETLLILEKELVAAEAKSGADSEEFASATALYVFTAIEVYGKQVKDTKSRQRLIDATVLVDSNAAKLAAAAAGVGITILMARFGGKAAGPVLRKVAGAGALVALLDIKNPGKKSAEWVAVTAVRKFLGPAPTSWPKPKPVAKKKPSVSVK